MTKEEDRSFEPESMALDAPTTLEVEQRRLSAVVEKLAAALEPGSPLAARIIHEEHGCIGGIDFGPGFTLTLNEEDL